MVFFTASKLQAKVAELVDALDLGSCGATRESSSLSFRTSFFLVIANCNFQDISSFYKYIVTDQGCQEKNHASFGGIG